MQPQAPSYAQVMSAQQVSPVYAAAPYPQPYAQPQMQMQMGYAQPQQAMYIQQPQQQQQPQIGFQSPSSGVQFMQPQMPHPQQQQQQWVAVPSPQGPGQQFSPMYAAASPVAVSPLSASPVGGVALSPAGTPLVKYPNRWLYGLCDCQYLPPGPSLYPLKACFCPFFIVADNQAMLRGSSRPYDDVRVFIYI